MNSRRGMELALEAMRESSVKGAPAEIVAAWANIAIAEGLPLLLDALDRITTTDEHDRFLRESAS